MTVIDSSASRWLFSKREASGTTMGSFANS
jgi:hypothetical protein